MAAPKPVCEFERLCALQASRLLDSPHSLALDQMTRAAARAFRVPISTISLIDADRQVYKSRVGLSDDETTRSDSFCTWVVYLDEPVVVTDTLQDERFCRSPFVVGRPFIRFYAGVPLRWKGEQTLGAFCILDSRPREFSSDRLKELQSMAAQVESLLQLANGTNEVAARVMSFDSASLVSSPNGCAE